MPCKEENAVKSLRVPVVLSVIAFVVVMLHVNASAQDTWVAAANVMNVAREQHTATRLADGRVLVAGGYSGQQWSKAAEVYSPQDGLWTATQPMNNIAGPHVAVLLSDGSVLAMQDSSAERFYATNLSWIVTGSMNESRERNTFTATLLPNGKVLVVGGMYRNTSGYITRGSAELYDPASGTWTVTGSLNQPRYEHTATLLSNGKVLVAGGCYSSGSTEGSSLTSAELYDPATGLWTVTGALQDARQQHTATLLNDGTVLVAAGLKRIVDAGGGVWSAYSQTAEVYDPTAGTWSNLTYLNLNRMYHTATLLTNGRVLVAGGRTSAGDTTRAEVYDPVLGMWNNTTSMNSVRIGHTATLLSNGQVLVAGGNQNGNDLATAELFTAAPIFHHFTVEPSTSTPMAGMAFSVTVTARDVYNNRVNSYGGTVQFNLVAPDPGAILPANYRFTNTDSGSHTFSNAITLSLMGSQTVNVTDVQWNMAGSTTVTPVALSGPVQIAIFPASATIIAGAKQRFTATASNMINAPITWEASAGTIDQFGLYTAPLSTGPVTVKASLTQDVTISATAVVTIISPTDKTLLSWGMNFYGELGNGVTASSSAPVPVNGLSGVTTVAAGDGHSLAVKNGQVWAWGDNIYGQLGNGTIGTNLASITPAQVVDLNNVTITSVSAGWRHSLALDTNGMVWAWGYNRQGELGEPSKINSPRPIQVGGISSVKSIAAGAYHNLALTTDGHVWAWGDNSSGQLGNGAIGIDSSTPVPVGTPPLQGIVAIAAGLYHSLAVDANGTVYAWGDNSIGQLGISAAQYYYSDVPVPVSGVAGISKVAAGRFHSVALTTTGEVWTWGDNSSGQLGIGTFDATEIPTKVQSPDIVGVTDIAAGRSHTLALTSKNIVATWGLNIDGELGDMSYTDTNIPTRAASITTAISVAAGGSHSVALTSDGAVWAWGTNGDGELGNTSISTNRNTPVRASNLSGLTAIAGGDFYSLALQSDGTLWSWGLNNHGQLGNNSTISTNVPGKLADPNLTGIVAMAAGGNLSFDNSSFSAFSLALRGVDGTIWAWGTNDFGQLGDGTTTSRTKPGQVSGLVGVVAVAVGASHGLAVMSDGTMRAWGRNGAGQLGDGTRTMRLAPVSVPGMTGVIAAAAGSNHTLALRNDGTVWAWGANSAGQLGNDSNTNSSTPVQVSNLSGIVAITAASNYSAALTSQGTVWAWGSNSLGELGNDPLTVPSSNKPIQVGTLSGVVAIAAGGPHMLAMTTSGAVFSWGYNDNGELGTGNALNSSTPVQVLNITGAQTISAGGYHSLALAAAPPLMSQTIAFEPLFAKTYGDADVPLIASASSGLTVTFAVGANDSCQLSGIDTVRLTGAGSCTVIASQPGNNDYSPAQASQTFTIGPASLTVTGVAANNKVYDGTTTATANTSNVMLVGIIGSDSPSADFASAIAVFADKNAGANKTVTISGISLTGPGAGNYVLSNPIVTTTASITAAILTIRADDKVMGVGGIVPHLTASGYGFVNGDTVSTVVDGIPNFTTSGNFNPSIAGTYTDAITVSQGGLTLKNQNYSLAFAPGTITVTADSLHFFNNWFVTGDYVARTTTTPLRGTGVGGVATGTINIPSRKDNPEGVPTDADIVGAFLYWQTIADTSLQAVYSNTVTFDGYTAYGDQIGSDIPYTDPAGTGALRVFRANVLPYMPVVAGQTQAAGSHTIGLPDKGTALPLAQGASLVVIYRVLSKQSQLKAVVIYDGTWVSAGGGMSQVVRGFYDAAGLGEQNAKHTYIYSSGQTWYNDSEPLTLTTGDRFDEQAAPGAWGAVVLSTPLNDSDGDGLPDAWEYAQGYYDTQDPTQRIPLPGADPGVPDVFIQYDYMCSKVVNGTCDTSPGQHSHKLRAEAVNWVTQVFAEHNINVHFIEGNAIQEETCTTDDPDGTVPQRKCVFPGEPGVVGWKVGVGLLKAWQRDPVACANGNNDACKPRVLHGQKDSYHYLISGHSLGKARWSIQAGNLEKIEVLANGQATVTTSSRASCPSRVTIVGAFRDPNLNGTYTGVTCSNDTTLTVATTNVTPGTYSASNDPNLGIAPDVASTVSGYSDIGGADLAVTFGKWPLIVGSVQELFTEAGTLMHEFGHNLGLFHGGRYDDGGGVPTFEVNCKSNYQSVMNYLHQIDLVSGALDYSDRQLDKLNENLLSGVAFLRTPLVLVNGVLSFEYAKYPETSWYSPVNPDPVGNTTEKAASRCDGSPLNVGEEMYRYTGSAQSLSWLDGQDINFDAMTNTSMRGYDDWSNIDLRQIGATGSHFVAGVGYGGGGGVGYGGGGGVGYGGGGGVGYGGGGGVGYGGGGGIGYGGGGGVGYGGGGGVGYGGGGGVGYGGGGGVGFGGGGGVGYGGGGGVGYGGGGGVGWGGGGGVGWGGGGGVGYGGGGGVGFGGGGGVGYGGGGGVGFGGGGGVDQELTLEIAKSYVHPPSAVTAAPNPGGGYDVTWTAAGFGDVVSYLVKRNGSVIATVPAIPSQITYTYNDPDGNSTYTYSVATLLGTGEQSTPNVTPGKSNQEVLLVGVPSSATYGDAPYAVSAYATSGLPVTITAGPNCSYSGGFLSINGEGTCTVSASQGGNEQFNAAGVSKSFFVPYTVKGFYTPISMSADNGIIWNSVKGGSTVPLKFNVYSGLVDQTSTSAVSGGTVYFRTVACVTGVVNSLDWTEISTSGSTSLRYDATAGEFIQNWKAPKTPGVCYAAQMTAADGISVIKAYIMVK